jgi:hypothetical protein
MTGAGLPHSDTLGSQLGWQLPEAYRSLPRPSSAPDAKTSTACPYTLTTTQSKTITMRQTSRCSRPLCTSQRTTTHHHHNPHRKPPPTTTGGNPHQGPQQRPLPETTHPHTPQAHSPHHHNRQHEPQHPKRGTAGPFPQDPTVCHPPPGHHHTAAPDTRPTIISVPHQETPTPPPTQTRQAQQEGQETPTTHPAQAPHPHASTTAGVHRLLRKEVIQPHLPVRLPCYDFVPIADPTFDHSPPRTG